MTGLVLAIDPGSEQSAWLLWDGRVVVDFAISRNRELLTRLHTDVIADVVVIEQIESYGMPVGREVLETVHWSGRFTEAIEAAGVHVVQLPRRAVKLAICRDSRAKDANIRQA